MIYNNKTKQNKTNFKEDLHVNIMTLMFNEYFYVNENTIIWLYIIIQPILHKILTSVINAFKYTVRKQYSLMIHVNLKTALQ